MVAQSSAYWVWILGLVARVASAGAMVVGCAVLAGWAFGLPMLESLLPGMSTMKINTALSAILAGLALWGALRESGRSIWRALCAYGGAGVVALIGLLTLLEYMFGWNSGIDQAPLPDSSALNNAISTGRMAPATALCALLIGAALLLLDTRRGRALSRWMTLGALAIALLALVGYLYDVRSLYAIMPFSSMAFHTALTFAVLCVGLLCARPSRGAIAVLVAQGTGSILMRRLLPAAIGLPLILGWLRLLGQRAGFYDTAFGLALFALSNILVFAILVWRNALYLNRADHQRRQVEQRLLRFNDELEQRVAERTAQLMHANQALEQANLAKDHFLANMSHELRTPLNAIIGFTGTLLMRLPGPLMADQEKQLTTIQSSAKHLLALINDVLDVSRIEAGERGLDLELVACLDLLAEVVDWLRPLALAKGIRLEIEHPGQEIRLLTDRRALSQILLNLVNNAIKFTDQGEVSISLRRTTDDARRTPIEAATGAASVVRPLASVEFNVRDSGIGISPEDHHKLFRVFTQLDTSASRSYEGTGLGLYLCRKLAELLGGQITFQSEVGQGSTFTLRLAEQPYIPAEHDRHDNLAAEIERN
jgi:signal transduction histidine kinase